MTINNLEKRVFMAGYSAGYEGIFRAGYMRGHLDCYNDFKGDMSYVRRLETTRESFLKALEEFKNYDKV